MKEFKGEIPQSVRETQAGRFKVVDANGFSIATCGYKDTGKANAHLFAASYELLQALLTIVEYNRQEAKDRYGDPEKAETWACVVTARAAISKAIKY